MAGGNDINNELTLDVSNFTAGLDKATKKLELLDDKLGKLDNKSDKLEKNLQDLGSNAKQASDKLGAVTQNLDGLAGGLDRVQKASKGASDGSKRFSGDLSALTKQARESDAAMSSVGDWTKFYGKSLDSLHPKMEKIAQTQKELALVTESSTKSEIKAIQNGLQDRIKALGDERKLNEDRIRARMEMVAQLEQIERRAESSATFARADAYKTNAKGKEVRRYVGRNSGRHDEIMAEVDAYKQEANLARQQKDHISAIVGEMEYRNSELTQAVKSEQELLIANKQTLQTLKQQREEVARLNEAKKDAAAREKELARQVAVERRNQAREEAAAEKQAQREIMQAQRQAHKELMQMRRDELQARKDIASVAAGTGTAGATAAGVHQIAEYQNADLRVKALGLSDAEYQRFQNKATALSASEKYLSRTDAMQARLDALTAIGYNKEDTIDKTIASATRNAYILRSTGFENGSMSDITKNLYGFAEARQVMNNPDEVNATFDTARRMSIASGGKLKIADIETVARSIGDLRQTMSSEGWVRLAAVMEQFKTAGGGNGGGGGVASVGTIFKMMSLYASGKPLTNGAAMSLMGADVLNEVYKDGSAQNFKNNRAANAAFTKAVKFAGFKDVASMSKDPVKFFTGLRGQLLDFMMQDSQFKQFFGADAKKHTYNKKGQMIDSDGKIVDEKVQDSLENAAFKRFFARMGLSNKAIDGMLLTTNRGFAERSYHAANTAMNSENETQIMADLSKTWTANMQELKASLVDFAVTFEPLLRELSAIPKAVSGVVRGLSSIGSAHNGIASLALAFLGVKVAMIALNGPLGLFAKSVLFGAGMTKAKNGLDLITSALTGTSSKMGQTAAAADDMARRTTAAGAAAGGGLSNGIATGVNEATSKAKVGTGVLLRTLGTLVNWAGWLTLAGMFGWAIGTWLSDIQVGGVTVGEQTQNLINSIVSNFKVGFQDIRVAWNNLIVKIRDEKSQAVRDAKLALTDATSTIAGIRNTQNTLHIRTDSDAKADLARSYAAQFKQIADSKKLGKFEIGGVVYKNISPQDAQKNYERLSKYNPDGIMPLTLPKSGRTGTQKGDVISEMNNKVLNSLDKETVAAQTARAKAKESPKKTEETLPDSFHAGTGAHITAPVLPKDPNANKKKRPEFVPQNAYDVSIANLKNESSKDISRLAELKGVPVDYDWLAKQAFIKEWMQGKLDDGRDPTKRPFATRAYSKGKPWTEGDINWNDPKVKQWVNLSKNNQTNDGIQKALEFAAGKIGEASANMKTAIDNWNQDSKTPSDTAKASREFGKFESKNPTATQNHSYKTFKTEALANIAGANYAEMAKDLRDQNKELNDKFLEDETRAGRESEKRRYETETKKVQAVRDSLNDQIAAIKAAYGEDDSLYKDLIAVKKGMDGEYTKYLENQDRLRVQNTRSAFDQAMAGWRDYQANIEGTLSNYGQQAGTDIWSIISGDKKMDVKGFASNMLQDVGGDLFKSAYGGLSKSVMGEGEGTSIFDYGKSLLGGTAANESGMIGRLLNKFRGLSGDAVETDKQPTTQLDATNQNTAAINNLTQALLGGASLSTSSGSGAVSNWTQSVAAGVMGGVENVPAVSLSNGGTGILDQIGAYGGYSAGDTANPFKSALGGGIDFGSDQNIQDQGQQTQGGGIFSSIKSGFTSLFSSTGEGGIFSSIKSGFSNIFNSDGEGGVFSKISSGFSSLFSSGGSLMSKIGSGFSGIVGSIGSMLGSVFGGNSVVGKLGGAAAGAAQGYASGGVGGAIAGGVAGLFANGGAFGGSGQIHAFANGGAFTNDIYNSPTMFKFAKGGKFGVMGEAGPEAVMPLARDGSGRLGVAVNGGGATGGSMVNIEINVTNQGGKSSENSSSDGSDNGNWNSLAVKVKSLVQEEIVKQKRPGGML